MGEEPVNANPPLALHLNNALRCGSTPSVEIRKPRLILRPAASVLALSRYDENRSYPQGFAAAYFLQFGIQKSAVPPQSRKAAWPGRICPLELISSNAISSPKESPQCRAPDLAVRSTRLWNGSPTFSVGGWDCRRRWLPLSCQYFRTEIFLLAVTQKPAWYLLSLAVPTVP